MSEDWRRIDIDALDPENTIQPEDLIPPTDPISSAEIQQQISNIRQYISKGSYSEAVQFATSAPPYGASPNDKESYVNTLLELFSVVKQNDIGSIVESLDIEQQNVLIKYIYKGFAIPKGKQQGGVLLSWYDKTVGVTGIGPVVRYLSDRRTI